MRAPVLALLLLTAAAPADTPAGLWQTPDRNGTTPAGTVRLFLHDGLLFGQIEQIYDPARRTRRCTACTDDRKDAPLLGLQIIRALHPGPLHPGPDTWTGGTVLDPDTGRTYRATIRVTDPAHLTIRGYLAIPLLGGSQTWTRVD